MTAQLPLTSLVEVAASTVIFVPVWAFIHYRVKRSGPFNLGKPFLQFLNGSEVVLAIYLLASIILATPALSAPLSSRSAIFASISDRLQADDGFISRYSYHLSKFYEYFDIFFFVADGGEVGLHFGFHHLTTPYLTYFRYLNGHYGWQLFAALNAFHHSLMYAFFAGVQSVHGYLPYTRYIQLVAGVAWDAWLTMYMDDGDSRVSRAVSIFLLTCYLYLLTREIRMRRTAEKEKSQ